jgi:hypothetical protein
MRVGDLVRYGKHIGVITHIDPEEIGDPEEVMVLWNDGDMSNASVRYLEVISGRS